MNQLRLAVDKQSRSQTFYSLSGPEREAMDISESLASDIIHPSSSPAGTGFFFVGKKYDSLRGMEALARRGRGSFFLIFYPATTILNWGTFFSALLSFL